METCDGEEEIAGNAPIVGAVSGGKEISGAVRNREWEIQLSLELLAMDRRCPTESGQCTNSQSSSQKESDARLRERDSTCS